MDMPAAELTAIHRCDRCGAQAKCVARKSGMEDLLFCNHHKTEHFDALVSRGWIVHTDEEITV